MSPDDYGDVTVARLPEDDDAAPRRTFGGNALHVDPRSLAGRPSDHPPGFTQHELGFAFAFENRAILRFEKTRGWFYWSGVRWKRDTTDDVVDRARQYINRVTVSFSRPGSTRLGGAGWARGMLDVSAASPMLAIEAGDWDKDRNIIGTPSGAVNLTNGEFIPANPSTLISKSTRADPTDNEDCPRWHQFLSEATGGDAAAILGLKRLAGYTLTAETREEKVVILAGDGENGKGAFLEALVHAFGDFARTIDFRTLLLNPNRRANEFAVFHGARLIVANETKKGDVWDDGTVKKLTGGDRIVAEEKYKDPFTFLPTHTLIVSLNWEAMPEFRIVDRGVTRRVVIAPFNFKPPAPDMRLKERLRAEAPGILRWAINGAVDWYRDGLPIPEAWKEATEDYLDEQRDAVEKSDPKEAFQRWLEECCVIGEEHLSAAGQLLGSWRGWARDSRVETRSFDFKGAMEAAGFQRNRTNAGTFYNGVGL